MDTTWLRLAVMAIGGMSLYLGYRLFCDAPHFNPAATRVSVVRNFLTGALLALLGLGILFTGARSWAAQHQPTHRGSNHNRPAEQGSYETPRIHREMSVKRMA
jgi:hypothetical protein